MPEINRLSPAKERIDAAVHIAAFFGLSLLMMEACRIQLASHVPNTYLGGLQRRQNRPPDAQIHFEGRAEIVAAKD